MKRERTTRPRWRPTTPAGRWAVRLALSFFGWVGLLQLLVALGQRGGATVLDNLWLAGTMLFAAGSAIGGGLAALLAIIRQRERSRLVIAAGGLGGLVLIVLIGELAFPH